MDSKVNKIMEELNLVFRSSPSELLSLQDLSITAAASLIWRSKAMKMAMEEVFDRHYPFWREHNFDLKIEKPCLEDLSVKISDTVPRIFNEAKISLPQVLKTEIENKVLEKVENVVNWILYLIQDLKLDYKTAERIYWTTDGCIDEDKIFRFYWSDQFAKEPVNWGRHDNNLTLLQYLACFFGQEEFISLHRSDYIKAIKPLEMDNNDALLTIMKAVLESYYNDRTSTRSNTSKRLKFYDSNISTVGMLSICKRFYFYKAFLFFWKRLDPTERFNYIETQSKTRIIRINGATIYGVNQTLKIILFLMEQMNERQKYKFILNNFSDVILTFSRDKKCKTFCMPLVERFLWRMNETETNNLLTNCADICNNSIQYDIELEIINRLLKNVPKHKRLRPVFHLALSHPEFSDIISQIIESFFENFNLPALKFIIKNASSESRKKQIIGIGERKYKELIRNNNFQLLDNFLDEVLSSETEKDQFKQDYNFLGEWIAQCSFDIVDNVLTWIHGDSSQDIKIPLKNLCYEKIPKYYEAMEALLSWFFDAHGPLINNCQSKLELLNDFCSGLIYNLWFPKNYTLQDADTAIDISTKILIFSFFSERDIQNFKTNVLANAGRCVKFFSEYEWQRYPSWQRGRLSALDDFLNFCNVPKEKMYDIKNCILNEEW